MNIKNVAIVLGGTFPHIRLIKRLQQRGYYVVLVDYYENPPAKAISDEHICESTLDKEAVLRIAKERDAKLIISTCIDQANVTATYVSEKMGLYTPYSYDTALIVSNKKLMKKIMLEKGVPTSRHIVVKEKSSYDASHLHYPLIVKPTDSNSSKGVRKVHHEEELEKFVSHAIQISRSKEAIIEEFIEGREIGADCIIKDKQAYIVMTRERQKITSSKDPLQQITGSLWPADLTRDNIAELKRIAEEIAYAFNLDNTPLMFQAIIKNDKIKIIEFAPRIGGGENYKIIELNTGYDIIDSAIDSFLGNDINIDYHEPEFKYSDLYFYTYPCVFNDLTGYEQLLDDGIIEYLNIYKAKGSEIGQDISSNNRIGALLIKYNDEKDLMNKIKTTVDSIEIYDINGKPVFRKDLYYKNQ